MASVRPRAILAVAVGLTLILAIGIVATTASARIVPGRGIAGVQIGERASSVRKSLGRPARVVPPDWFYGAPLAGWVGLTGHRVDDVWTHSHRQHTRRGIGPGSTLRATKRAYPKAHCHRRSGRWDALCVLTFRGKHRSVDTDFLFKGRRLAVVDMFRVRRPKKRGPF